MVVFPALTNEAKLLTVPLEKAQSEDLVSPEFLVIHQTVTRGQDQFYEKMSPRKDSIVLSISQLEKDMEKSKLEFPVDNITAEPAIVKKIAAGLKSCGEHDVSHDSSFKDIGSLSSGSSIITISEVTSSDPDPDQEYQNDADSPPKKKRRRPLITEETWQHTALQISVPFFIAGIGTIGAGLVLDKVHTWPVFKQVSQIFILVPALLGLKGNLDMCLASRLSTQVNLGNMKGCREILKMILGNIALVQVQAIVAAALVAVFANLVNFASHGEFSWEHSLLVITASICTATSSCFVLDFVMIAVIMGAKKLRMNPDNLATPLAASIGDVVSISVLSVIASELYVRLDNSIWILYVIVSFYIILLPIWILIVLKNKYTSHVLTSGWIPVISALFISSLGGLILDKAVSSDIFTPGFLIFQPIINGIGGNLVSVQASRISTMFHQSSLFGILPPFTKTWITPVKALFIGVPSAKTARILILMSIPGHLLFSFAADYINAGQMTIHIYFITAYLTVAVIQVMFLLYVAHVMIHKMWVKKIDPDNSAIPYLTALGDLSGSVFLALAFVFLDQINHRYIGLVEE